MDKVMHKDRDNGYRIVTIAYPYPHKINRK